MHPGVCMCDSTVMLITFMRGDDVFFIEQERCGKDRIGDMLLTGIPSQSVLDILSIIFLLFSSFVF